MAKAGSSKPAAPPAKGGDKGFKGKGKPDKVIQKTADLIKGNGSISLRKHGDS
jgi:hypothetical protein